jgi:hypothetical protein
VDLRPDVVSPDPADSGVYLMKATSREHLLSRMKAGLERLLTRRRRIDPLPDPPPEPRPLPSRHHLCEILGTDLNRRAKGPGKSA